MQETVTALLIVAGAVLMFVAGLGITRMPDLFLRMSATTKVATLGVGTVLLAVTIYFNDLVTTFHALATLLFIFASAPVAAHMIGRAAYFNGVPLWKGSLTDELRGHYDLRTHQLESVPFPALEHHLPDMQIRKVSLPAASPLAGYTLAQIDLRRKYDVTLLAIRRGSLVITNPSGDVQVCPHDELILLGHPDKLDGVATLFPSAGEGSLRP